MANGIVARSRENKAAFKARAIEKYKSADKKKILKKAAMYTAGAAAAGGAAYGAYKWGDKGKMGRGRALVKAKRAPGAALAMAKSAPSKAKFAGIRAGVKAKKAIAPKLMRGNKGLSWGEKGAATIKAAKSKKRHITAQKVMHPKHWRRYVKAEDLDFTRDDLIEMILEELLSE